MRMLIWTPLNAAELQKAMHGASVGPAALVPVQSGTVLLVSRTARQLDALRVAVGVRKIAGSALLAVWNEDAGIVYPVAARVSRGWSWGARESLLRLSAQANQYGVLGRAYDRVFGRLFDHRDRETWQSAQLERFAEISPQADRETVAGLLRDFLSGAAAVPKLFHALGLPDVAQVAELAEEGRADAWLEPLTSPRPPKWAPWAFLPLVLLGFAASIVLSPPLWLALTVYLAPFAAWYVVLKVAEKRLVTKKPINTVLPVIPVTQGAAPTD